MQQGNWNEALEQLKPLEKDASSPYHEMARYQMAVCYKALGKKGKARRLFKRLISENSRMKEEAESQLSSL